MKWAAVVPLIGGQLVGTEKATGLPPAEIASYSGFEFNDGWSVRRYPSSPYRVLDRGGRLTGKYDMVVSTCPCAGLSLLSMAKAGSESRAKQNQWMLHSAEYVLGEVRPGIYFGENAPGMFTNMGSGVVTELLRIAEKHGYSASFYRTDTDQHGIPQRRRRTFYYFTRDGGSQAPILPWHKSPMVSASDYLAKIPPTAPNAGDDPFYDVRDWSVYKYLHGKYGDRWRDAGQQIGSRPYTNAYELIRRSQQTRAFVDACRKNGWTDGFQKAMARSIDKLSRGIGDGVFIHPPIFDRNGSYPALIKKTVENVVHPTEDRFLNAREVMHLMGMPLDYEIVPNRNLNIVCQNVPSESARAATDLALAWLDGKTEMTDESVTWACNVSEMRWVGAEKKRPSKVARIFQ